MVKTRAEAKPKPATIKIPDETFEVENILDIKEESGNTFYLIKWKGYSKDSNTWEPEENLENCPLMIKEFKRLRTAKPREAEKSKKLIPTINIQPKETLEVMGIIQTLNSFCFLTENPKTKKLRLVERNEANKSCPQAVIKFYEAHFHFVHIKNEKL